MELLSEEELNQLEAVQNRDQWKNACLSIKSNHGGKYPQDWYEKVLKSGLVARVLTRFGESTELQVRFYEPNKSQ